MTTNQAIGEQIHGVMWRKNVTQAQLAQVLGITQAAISKKVRGKRPFTIEELQVASDHLEVSTLELLGSAGLRCYIRAAHAETTA